MATAPKLLSKFKGCLVTAVAGDCLGAYFEAINRVPIDKVIDFFNEKPKDDSKPHYFTDDTAMARSVAFSLIQNKKMEPVDMAKRFVSEFEKEPGRGYGGNVGTVFDLLSKSECKDPYFPASQQFGGSGSYGNGGAMRIAPAALFGFKYNQEDLNVLVDDITRLTHTHMDAVNGAILQCTAVHRALHQPPDKSISPDEFLDSLIKCIEALEAKPKSDSDSESDSEPKRKVSKPSRTYCDKLRSVKRFLAEDTPPTDVTKLLGNDVSALGSVVTAIYAFLKCLDPTTVPELPNPLERTIYFAISLGGDTDTIATMAGAVAGAYYGMEHVPPGWLETCEGMDEALEQAEQFFSLCSSESPTKEGENDGTD